MVHFLVLARDLAKASLFSTRARIGSPSVQRSHPAVGIEPNYDCAFGGYCVRRGPSSVEHEVAGVDLVGMRSSLWPLNASAMVDYSIAGGRHDSYSPRWNCSRNPVATA